MGIVQSRLKEYRKVNNFTQAQMANELGVTQQTYQEWESGKIEDLRSSTITRICETFHMSADYVLGLTDNMIPMCNKCHREIERTEKFVKSKALQEEEFMLEQLQQLRDSLK